MSDNVKRTVVHEGAAHWSRDAYLVIEGDKVKFDCSDGEYGPIEFDLEKLVAGLKLHLRDDNDLP